MQEHEAQGPAGFREVGCATISFATRTGICLCPVALDAARSRKGMGRVLAAQVRGEVVGA